MKCIMKFSRIMICSHFLHQYVDTAQGKTFPKSHGNLSSSRYSKGQKGKKIEKSRR